MLLSFVLLTSFSFVSQGECRRSGIRGHVYQVRGNQMPSPDITPEPPKGVKTTLYIYELTNIADVTREANAVFYTTISTKLVKKIETDDDGSFKVKLKPGRYSLFVKKDDKFYSSQFDDKNNIHPVEVKSGKMTEDIFQANYNAVY